MPAIRISTAEHSAASAALISRCMNHSELIFIQQVHGTAILTVNDELIPMEHSGRTKIPTADALIACCSGKSLVIQVADCQAVLLYDPVQKAVANIHSGWRSSIRNIIGLTVQAMIKEFGTDPGTLLAGIGPSLGPCCAEFIHYQSEIPRDFWQYKIKENGFDFWAVSKDQLITSGVPHDHIISSNLCTRCRTDLFFSYRKEKTTGRFAAVIGIR